MKKITLFLLVSILIVLSANSFSQVLPHVSNHNVPIDIARQVAKKHYFNYCNMLQYDDYNDIHFSQENKFVKNSDTLYYIFNCQGNKGFVIVAADFRAEPVLGYSSEGNLNDSSLNPGSSFFLDTYKEQIEFVKVNNLPVNESIESNWNSYFQKNNISNQALSSVGPLITTLWKQFCYYNASCPSYTNGPCGKAFVGCVAIQMGMIMKYWNYPATGNSSHTYFDPGCCNLSADFANTTYNWSAMPNSVTAANPSVAKLLFHCGVSVNMDYGVNPAGSASNSMNVANALKTYFNYSSQAVYVYKSNYTSTLWNNLLKNEIDNSRPVAYRGTIGSSSNSGGHAFVLDGYQGTNLNNLYFHFNFGWGAGYNGNYLLSAINPPTYSGTNYSFNYNQCATIKIFPNSVPPPPVPTLSTNNCGPKILTRASPPTGFAYYWQGTSCGTSTSLGSLSNFTVTASGTYYLSAKDLNTGAWSTCSSKAVTINQIPSAPPAATVSTNNCGPKILTRPSPPPLSGIFYYWQGTTCGASASLGSATNYTATSTGTYYLQARINSTGCWSTSCDSVSVVVNASPSPGISGQNSVCSNSNGVVYSVTNSGNNFSWTINGGTITSGQNTDSIAVNWGNGGTGIAILTETNPSTNCSTTDSLNVTINSTLNPSIIASGPTTVCQGDSVMLDASSGFSSYLWSNGETNQIITVANGTFSVTVSDASGCTGSSANPIIINENPNPSPIISGQNPVCPNSNGVIYSVANSGNNFSWSLSGGTIISGIDSISTSVNWGASGNETLTVTETNPSTNCSTTASENITINPNPDPLIIANGSTTICDGESIIIIASSGFSSYLWSNNDTTQLITVENSGTYSVIVTDTNGCAGSSSTMITVNVNPIPAIPTITQNDSLLFSSSTINNQWYLDGVLISGATSQTFIITQDGAYTVSVSDTSSGCYSLSDPINYGNVGIEQSEIQNPASPITVYPNPSNGSLKVQVDFNYILLDISIMNVLGEQVYFERIKANTSEISINNISHGIYFLRVMADNRQYSRKIIVR